MGHTRAKQPPQKGALATGFVSWLVVLPSVAMGTEKASAGWFLYRCSPIIIAAVGCKIGSGSAGSCGGAIPRASAGCSCGGATTRVVLLGKGGACNPIHTRPKGITFLIIGLRCVLHAAPGSKGGYCSYISPCWKCSSRIDVSNLRAIYKRRSAN